jgi:hypothetical protein
MNTLAVIAGIFDSSNSGFLLGQRLRATIHIQNAIEVGPRRQLLSLNGVCWTDDERAESSSVHLIYAE